MSVDTAALRTATKVAFASSSALANASTTVTALILTPALEVLLFVAVAWSTGTRALEGTAYASVAVAFGLGVMGGAVEQVTLDRQLGVLHDMLSFRRLSVPYWISRVGVPFTLGLVPAVAGCGAVYALSGRDSVSRLLVALGGAALCALSGALVGSAAATASIALAAPYLGTNVGHVLRMVTAGVVVPLSALPTWLASLAQALPLTNAVAMIRDGAFTWQRVILELVVASAWCALGATISARVWRSVRAGRREEVW
jgi:hypothetical protein